jgi:hypothetical protein
MYKILTKSHGRLGGNGYNGAIYGELTFLSMQRVIDVLVLHCGMNTSSRLLDVGSGLGKPNFHSANDVKLRLSIGVELEEIRWKVCSSVVIDSNNGDNKLINGFL